jgi:hypothetical protein
LTPHALERIKRARKGMDALEWVLIAAMHKNDYTYKAAAIETWFLRCKHTEHGDPTSISYSHDVKFTIDGQQITAMILRVKKAKDRDPVLVRFGDDVYCGRTYVRCTLIRMPALPGLPCAGDLVFVASEGSDKRAVDALIENGIMYLLWMPHSQTVGVGDRTRGTGHFSGKDPRVFKHATCEYTALE